MAGEGRGQAKDAAVPAATACTAESVEQSCGEPVPKKQKSERDDDGDDDARCGTVSYKLTVEAHKTLLRLERAYPNWSDAQTKVPEVFHGAKWACITAEMRARFPQLKINGGTLSRTCTRAKHTRELKELRAIKEDHDAKAGLKAKEGPVLTAERQKEIGTLRARLEVLERENKEIQKQCEQAEKHVVVLKGVLDVERSEKSDLAFKLRAEKRKVALLAKQLHELQRMLYEDAEEGEDTQETQGPEQAED